MRVEGADETAGEPSTSGADAARTSNARSRRRTTTPCHHDPSGNPQQSQSHQSIRPVPSPHNPASVSSGHQSDERSAASSPNDGHKSPGSSIVSGSPSPESQRHRVQSPNRPYTVKWINGKKNLECNVCTKTFNEMGHLNRHMRTHTGERPFKCEICKKRFALNSNFKDHLRIHTGEKPHQCHICKRRFSHLSTFYRHLQTHTGDTQQLHGEKKTTNCEANSIDERSLGDSNGSDVEGNYLLFCKRKAADKSKLKTDR